MPEISSDAQKVLSGASQEAMDYVLANTPGSKLTSGEASTLLQKFQANAGNVFTTDNINQASTSPQIAPDDLLGIRNQINQNLGIPQLQQNYQDIYSQLKQYDLATVAQNQALQEQPVSLNLIRGQQATASAQRSQERLGLATEADVAQSALLAAQQEARDQFGIREGDVRSRQQLILQNPGAKITFGDTIEQAAKKIADYNKQVQKEADKKAQEEADKAYKASLKAAAMELGISTKNKKGGSLSTKDLEKKIAAANKAALDEAKRIRDLELSAKLSGGSSSSDAAQEKAFYSTVDSLQQQMSNDKISWSMAWSTLHSRYPDLSVNAIDDALGLAYRDKYDK